MPGMNGLETIEAIRRLSLLSSPTLLMITAFSSEIPEEDIGENNIPYILPKPVTPSRLKDALENILTRMAPDGWMSKAGDIRRELASGSYGKVLLAEDNPINREVAVGLLDLVGIRNEIAENGQIAVEMAAAEEYALILLDLQMPVMDGLEATRIIRSLPGRSTVPIIAMTAVAFEEDRLKCLSAGMNDYLAKPVDPDDLYRMLRKWLPAGGKKPQESASATSGSSVSSVPGGAASAVQPSGADGSMSDSGREVYAKLTSADGINADFGLKNLQGNVPWYLKLLSQFADRHGNDASSMRAALTENRMTDMERICHNIKGTSATLGLFAVRDKAVELERRIRGKDDTAEITKGLDLFEKELLGTVGLLKDLLPAAGKPALNLETAVADVTRADSILKRIEPLIRTHDTSVNDQFDLSKQILLESYGEIVRKLEDQIQEFNYEAALETLLSIRAAAAKEQKAP